MVCSREEGNADDRACVQELLQIDGVAVVVRDNSGRFPRLTMVSEVFDYFVGGLMDAGCRSG